jgi:voltage-gated potassium channel
LLKSILHLPTTQTSLQTLLRRIFLVLGLLIFIFTVLWLDRDGLRDCADSKIDVIDVIYFTVITVSTVGYGDIVPVTPRARLLDVVLITPIRLFIWLIFLGTAYELVIQKFLEEYRMKRLQSRLKGHTIVCGYGSTGESACRELVDQGLDLSSIVVVDPDELRLKDAANAGFTGIQGDACRESILDVASVSSAAALIIATGRDDTNILICLTGRSMNGDAFISVKANQEENVKLIRRSGADTIVLPASAGGRLLAAATARGHAVQFLDDLLTARGRVSVSERLIETGEQAMAPPCSSSETLLGAYRNGQYLSPACLKSQNPDDETGNSPKLLPGDSVLYLRVSEDDNIPPSGSGRPSAPGASITPSRNDQRGVAIGMLLPILVFLFIIGMAFVINTTGKYRIVNQETDSIKATYLAEAAAEEAFWVTRNMMNYVSDNTASPPQPGWNNDFQVGFGNTPKVVTPMLAHSADLVSAEDGANLDSVVISILDPTRFSQAPAASYNQWDQSRIESNTFNPENVPYPAHYADPSTTLAQGPPNDSFGTLRVEATVTVNKITKTIVVTRDYKCVDITPPATEYALYVRQGPFGNDSTWPLTRQINEEFNSGGKLTVFPGQCLTDPTERRLHIKGPYVIDSGTSYHLNMAIGPDVMDMIVGGMYYNDPDKADDAVCYGPSIIPPPRCVYHWGDTSLLGFLKKVHLLHEDSFTSVELSFGLVSKFNAVNGRRFNSGVTTHRTSLFGENMLMRTGLEGRMATKFKQWWIRGWKFGLGVNLVHLNTEGGDEVKNVSYAPYKCYSQEPPTVWDHIFFDTWKNALLGLIGLTNPLSYTIQNLAGWNDYFQKPEMREFFKQFKACDVPFIIPEPGSPDPYYSNAKFDAAQTLTYMPTAARRIDNLSDLTHDGFIDLAGGIIASEKADFGTSVAQYVHTGVIYTEKDAIVRADVKAANPTSYLTLIKKGTEYPFSSPIATAPPQERVQFTGGSDIDFIGSMCSTNSLKVDSGMKVRILGNLTVDRIQKHAIEGDVEVHYDENYLNNRFGPAVPSVRGMTYAVELSPSVSSWVDESRKGK